MKCEGCVNHHVTMDVTNTGNWQRARQTGNEKSIIVRCYIRVLIYDVPSRKRGDLEIKCKMADDEVLQLTLVHGQKNSRWRGQQHKDSNGILGGSRGHHRRYLHLFTTYFHHYIQNIQIYSTVIAKTQIGAQGENPEQRFQDGYHMVKFEMRGQNLRNFLRPHTNSLKLVITIDRNHFVPFSESS